MKSAQARPGSARIRPGPVDIYMINYSILAYEQYQNLPIICRNDFSNTFNFVCSYCSDAVRLGGSGSDYREEEVAI